MKRTIAVVVLAALAAAAFMLDAVAEVQNATRVVEMKGEPLNVFIKRLPGSFEAQVFYALWGAWLLGALGSWLWKWSQGQADGLAHFTVRYVVGQLLFGIGISIAAIMTVGFQTEDGTFFGWLSVLWSGGFAGFAGDTKIKAQRGPVWTPEEREAKTP